MKQSIRVAPGSVHAQINIPGSKSITNRALLLAALADGVSEIFDVLVSDDTTTMVNALHQLGVAVQLDAEDRSCIVGGSFGSFPRKKANIWCADAGTVARFLLTACAASPGKYHFDASPTLQKRPMKSLLQVLTAQGATIIPENAEGMPCLIEGTDGLQGGKVLIDSSETSQFVSALLMTAPYAQSQLTIETKHAVSFPYIEMTCQMMAEFGVMVRRLHKGCFSVPIPQRYQAREYRVEPDLSTASYFFAAAAVTNGEITIQAVDRKQSKQGDIAFLTILEKMGCKVIEHPNGLTVKGAKQLHGVSVDMRNFSDTFMTLAAIAPFANSPTTITNIGHTRLQESDRIAAMRQELEKINVRVEEGPDWIRIYPSSPMGGIIDAHRDHRIAMAFSVMGLCVDGIVIEGAECVAKTCPGFFELWESLI